MKISANVLIRNEYKYIDGLIKNLLEADIDELIFLDGGSNDGSYEKLIEYEKHNKKIKVLRWPQPDNSEYKRGFKEKERRNLMMQASSCEYILYIDADERIDIDLKNKLNDNGDIYLLIQNHFWDKYIRINMTNDNVWSPEYKYRIIKNNGIFKFNSFDKNGLHNYIAKNKIKIYNEKSKNKYKAILAKIINKINRVNVVYTDVKIYHLHYYNITTGIKVNDLRINDLKREKIILDNIDDGLKHDYKKENIICLLDDKSLEENIKKYI